MAIFEVKINDSYSLKGNDYLVKNPISHLLIITGMQEHSSRYEALAKELNKENISVSVLDHFGQGENAISVEDQQKWPVDAWKMTLQALNNKVNELRKDNKPVYLMGHSMGSFATQAYIETYPNTVDKVIIMSSNGKNNNFSIQLGYKIAKLITNKKNWDKEGKLMGKLSLGAYSRSVKNRKSDIDWLTYNEENVKAYAADPYCGHYNTNGFYREFMKGMAQLYKKKSLNNISKNEKILIVAGDSDPVGANAKGPKSLLDMYTKLGLKEVELIVYPHMRHEILNEDKKEDVYNDIKNFLLK